MLNLTNPRSEMIFLEAILQHPPLKVVSRAWSPPPMVGGGFPPSLVARDDEDTSSSLPNKYEAV